MFRFRPSSLLFVSCLTSIGLLGLSVERAHASSIVASAGCVVTNVDNDEHSTVTPGVATTATLSAPHACSSEAMADYGVLKLGSALIEGQASYVGYASAQFTINFTLTDPNLPANTPIVLAVPIMYDLVLGVTPGGIGGSSNGADFSIYEGANVSPFWVYRVATSTDSLGNGNICPSPQPSLPACNGRYQGTATAYVNAVVNSIFPQRIWITASESVVVLTDGSSASVDALHTITLGNVVLPDGVTYAYDSDITGNPANFIYAAPTDATVPEPSTWCLLTAGLGMLLAGRRRVRA